MGQNAMEDQVVGWFVDKNCFPLLFEDLPGQPDQFGVTTQTSERYSENSSMIFE